jgi:hypothetical protein
MTRDEVTADEFEPYPSSDLATLHAAATVLERLSIELEARMRAFPDSTRKLLNPKYDALFRLKGDYGRLAVELRELKMPPVEGEQ